MTDVSNEFPLVNKPRPGVGIAVIVTSKDHPDCILLGIRKNKVGKGLLQLPGGHLEFGESWEDCACREILEETGLHLSKVRHCQTVNTVVPEVDYHYVVIFMRGEVGETGPSEPENKEPGKCEGWRWIRWDNIPDREQLFYALRDFRALKGNLRLDEL